MPNGFLNKSVLLLRTAKMSATAHIQKFSKNSDGHTEYFIKVVFNGKQWAIRKRYSEFTTFDEYLQRSGYKVNYTLPEKTWWKRFDPQVLVQRQKELQQYLNVLLGSTISTENSLIREFLEVDENRLALAKRQTFREFKYSENLDAIVATFPRLMIDIPSSRNPPTVTPSKNRQMSTVFQRMNSLGTGFRTFSNNKSTSFSQRPMLKRGETVTSDSGGGGGGGSGYASSSSFNAPMTPIGRERRFSVDVFSQMVSSSSPRPSQVMGDNDFQRSVNALWVHYEPPITQEIEDMEAGGDCPVHMMDSTSPTLPLDVMSCLVAPITTGSRKSDSLAFLETEIDRMVADVPFYINDILKANNPVFLSFNGPSPVIPGCSISSSVHTECESQSEGGSRNNSTASGSNAHKQVHEEEEEDAAEAPASPYTPHSQSSNSDKLNGLKILTPSTSLESLAR